MSYSTSNPPSLLAQSLNGGRSLWMYVSADDENAFDDTDYFTNASELGMKTGDAVIAVDTGNGLTSIAQVTLDADGNGTLSAFTAVSA